MGDIFTKKKPEEPESAELTEGKIKALENSIRIFIDEQEENIKLLFNDKNLKEQKIDYIIDANDKLIKGNRNPLQCNTDYAIQWSIQGNNEINSTKCHLTFFNIGGLLGANGFLYSICQFYYFFSKIPNENRNKTDVIEDIEMCLKLIDEGEISKLNFKWRTNINKEILNNLRLAKDFLLNLFHEKITNELFETSNNKLIQKIMRRCPSFRQNGVSKLFLHIFYFLTCQLSEREREEEYLKEKNAINRYHLPRILLKQINLNFFAENNVFILASDDDTVPLKNFGVAFMGKHIPGLGEFHRARRLIENEIDGFMTNNSNNNNKNLYNFYYNKIKEIKSFFDKNKDNINNINKGMNHNNTYYIDELAKEIESLNLSHLNEGVVDKIEEDILTERTTSYTHSNYLNEANNHENVGSVANCSRIANNYFKSERNIFKEVEENMGACRAYEMKRIIERDLNNNNINYKERISVDTYDQDVSQNNSNDEKEDYLLSPA